MEFDLGRMTDVDGDNMFEYLDALPDQTTPILYLSAAGGRYNKATDATVHDDYDVFGDSDPRNLAQCYTQPDGSTLWKSDTFQLISPGSDGEYGAGGPFSPDEDLDSTRGQEGDNITNFSGGTLE